MKESSKVEVTGQHEKGIGALELQRDVEDECYSGMVLVHRDATPAEHQELKSYVRRRRLCRCAIGLALTCLVVFGLVSFAGLNNVTADRSAMWTDGDYMCCGNTTTPNVLVYNGTVMYLNEVSNNVRYDLALCTECGPRRKLTADTYVCVDGYLAPTPTANGVPVAVPCYDKCTYGVKATLPGSSGSRGFYMRGWFTRTWKTLPYTWKWINRNKGETLTKNYVIDAGSGGVPAYNGQVTHVRYKGCTSTAFGQSQSVGSYHMWPASSVCFTDAQAAQFPTMCAGLR